MAGEVGVTGPDFIPPLAAPLSVLGAFTVYFGLEKVRIWMENRHDR